MESQQRLRQKTKREATKQQPPTAEPEQPEKPKSTAFNTVEMAWVAGLGRASPLPVLATRSSGLQDPVDSRAARWIFQPVTIEHVQYTWKDTESMLKKS